MWLLQAVDLWHPATPKPAMFPAKPFAPCSNVSQLLGGSNLRLHLCIILFIRFWDIHKKVFLNKLQHRKICGEAVLCDGGELKDKGTSNREMAFPLPPPPGNPSFGDVTQSRVPREPQQEGLPTSTSFLGISTTPNKGCLYAGEGRLQEKFRISTSGRKKIHRKNLSPFVLLIS